MDDHKTLAVALATFNVYTIGGAIGFGLLGSTTALIAWSIPIFTIALALIAATIIRIWRGDL